MLEVFKDRLLYNRATDLLEVRENQAKIQILNEIIDLPESLSRMKIRESAFGQGLEFKNKGE